MQASRVVPVVLMCMILSAAAASGAAASGKGFTDKNGIYNYPKPNLVVTLGWSGAKVQLPAPIDMHSTVLAGPEGQEWLNRGDKRTIHYTNKGGWRYEAEAICMSMDAEGRKCPILGKIVAYRPNGTMAKETTYSPDGGPDNWKVYDPQGRLAMEVLYRLNGLPGTPFVRDVKYYNPDGSIRALAVNNPAQVADWETLEIKGQEIKTLHYCRKKAAAER